MFFSVAQFLTPRFDHIFPENPDLGDWFPGSREPDLGHLGHILKLNDATFIKKKRKRGPGVFGVTETEMVKILKMGCREL